MINKRLELAHHLDILAMSIDRWSEDVWNVAFRLAGEVDHPAASEAYEELIHYSGEFNSRNLLGLRVGPDKHQLENYADEFRRVAEALKAPN